MMDSMSGIKSREPVVEFTSDSANNPVHNSSSFVARLPHDVLACIFLLHKDAVIEAHRLCEEYEQCHTFTAVPWISPCHVCSSWRAITLECPTFWNVLLLSNANATRELLIRSKQAPLDVGGHYHTTRVSGQTFVECLSLVLQESYRIEVLDLSCATHVLQQGAWKRIAESMPAAFEGVEFPTLRQVTLHGDRYTGFPDGYAAVGKALFQKLLSQPLKCLQDLRMKHCPANFWQALPPTATNRMTSLTLSITIAGQILSKLLSFLSALPNLQKLDIEDVTRVYNRDIEMQSTTLPMPDLSSLRSLALIVRPMHIKSLLESIQFSHKLAHCRVRPHILLAEYDVEHVLNCVLPFQPQAKSASIEITSSKGNRSVEIHLSTYQEVTALEHQTFSPPISAWDPHSCPLSNYRSSRTPQLDIRWGREYVSDSLADSSFPPTSNDPIMNKVETLLQEVEVLSLRILTNHGRHPVVDAWLSMLGHLPSIERLDIWQSGVQHQEALLRYLSTPVSLLYPAAAATQPFHFKSMKQLNFEGAVFCFEHVIKDVEKGLSAQLDNMDPQPSHELFPSIRELFNVIEKRWSDENFALKRLSFTRSSGVDSKLVQRFKELVDCVEWDGVVMSPYSPVIDQGSSPAVYYAADDDKEEESNYSSN